MELAPRNTFRKGERIYKKSELENLVKTGNSFVVAPVRVVWARKRRFIKVCSKNCHQCSKRRIRNATDRNRIKRLIRESYRIHKHTLAEHFISRQQTLHILLIYNGNLNPSFTEVERKIMLILQRLKEIA